MERRKFLKRLFGTIGLAVTPASILAEDKSVGTLQIRIGPKPTILEDSELGVLIGTVDVGYPAFRQYQQDAIAAAMQVPTRMLICSDGLEPELETFMYNTLAKLQSKGE
ncbi:MAG: hypothetical protein KAS32_05540 [Candidatus Peribacteraceae bacterium]|nr:hypothetical protein [Candidatus Peribacteraceae bacterium]